MLPPTGIDDSTWGLLLGPLGALVTLVIFAVLMIAGKLRPGSDSEEWKKIATAALDTSKEANATAKRATETAEAQVKVTSELRDTTARLLTELTIERELRERLERERR